MSGRKRLTSETVALSETRSRLDVAAADGGRLDALLAEAWTHATGYRFGRWAERAHAGGQRGDGLSAGGSVDAVAADRVNRAAHGRNGSSR